MADWPKSINHFIKPAKIEVYKAIRNGIPVESAILDDWGGAIRIIWGTKNCTYCGSRCSTCPLFLAVSIDPDDLKADQFTPTLKEAPAEYLEIFSAKQKQLNCKTIEQYMASFVEYFIAMCNTEELLRAELEWVKNFILLYMDNNLYMDNPDGLEKKARRMKLEIIRRCLEQLDQDRAEYLRAEAKELGLV